MIEETPQLLRKLAANLREFVRQVDAPTLHDRLNTSAEAHDESANVIERLCDRLRAAEAGDANDSRSLVLKSASAEGVIRFMRGDRATHEPPCVCCPGESGHIFSRGVEFGPFEDSFPDHFGHGVRELLGTVIGDNSLDGKRVRVTVEVLSDGGERL